MAEEKETPKLEREYIIPLRREWLKLPEYRRAGRAAKAIKKFIAKHMKVPERDVEKVKLDIYLNNELWCRGARKPPARVHVKAVKENDLIKVSLVEMPKHLKFLKIKNERMHKKTEKKKSEKPSEELKAEESEEEKKENEEKKKDEKEKEKAGEEQKIKEAKIEKQVQKHAAKDKKVEIHRRSMDRH